ncbi:MAG: response regulator [Deltaproteobacteria bacterium]|nr:response regulator [Deltaproteobacteria bacterium]
MTDTRVLIIDDEKENVRYLTTVLEENGFKDIHAAFDGVEGVEKIWKLDPGLILLDLRMPRKGGIYVFNEVKKSEKHRNIPIVILTGEGGFLRHLAEMRDFHEDHDTIGDVSTEEVLNRFIDTRPDAFLEKPVEPDQLMSVIRNVLITLDGIKEKRCREINALLNRKTEGGVSFKGDLFDSDQRTRVFLTGLALTLTSGRSAGADKVVIRSSDAGNVALETDAFLAFYRGMINWLHDNLKASWRHTDAVNALTRIGDVEEYNIYEGWPDNRL